MYKFYSLTIVGLLFFINSFCQQKTDTTILRDSLSSNNSYFELGLEIGNNLFSSHNNNINAKQSESIIAYSPSIAYYHKSGLGITATDYLIKEKNSFGVNQYAISPSYTNDSLKHWMLQASYTHYFVQNEFSKYASPIQNDFYVTAVYKKYWLQPGINIGYSTGEFKDVKNLDTTIANINRHYYDSSTNQLKSFLLSPSIEHEFNWYSIFNKNDELSFIPEILLDFGSNNTATLESNTNVGSNGVLAKRIQKIINNRLSKFQNAPFQLQSISASLEAGYQIGSFVIQPQVYLNYYLPETSSKRFTQVYVIDFGYVF